VEIKVDVEPHVWQKFTQMAHDTGKNESTLFSEMVRKAFEDFISEHPETAEKLGLPKPKKGAVEFPK
jgi:hypothetical protein